MRPENFTRGGFIGLIYWNLILRREEGHSKAMKLTSSHSDIFRATRAIHSATGPELNPRSPDNFIGEGYMAEYAMKPSD